MQMVKCDSMVECAGCGSHILDRYYLSAVDQHWHVSCLKCSQCKVNLQAEPSCFSRDGLIFCKSDYYRLFTMRRCSRCGEGIYASELVMRVRDHNVYHLQCFTCAWCNVTLAQGDLFGVRDNLINNSPHSHGHHHQQNHSNSHSQSDPESGAINSLSNESLSSPPTRNTHSPVMTNSLDGGGPLSGLAASIENSCNSQLASSAMNSLASHQSLGSGNSSGSSNQRTKRMRTSFKHHQLRTMKSYFGINQNPDAKDLKALAQKTGLSKRVLQVWFQNARAKWRRNNLKMMPDAQHELNLNGQTMLNTTMGSHNPSTPSTIIGSPSGSTRPYSSPSPLQHQHPEDIHCHR
ncbi:LIM/homeobox protein Lhx9-like protein [Euroglyphus maynei]|uniref:LIM/homeobox protein Lhx9-like protein n=1 Tax=Euroglyphus maynei TaxID=6958 RepID=A0A1Y3ALM5_EURMA|nr:LIM/homeobox protein Lhx9-like protein [Euroglyphus maynei]